MEFSELIESLYARRNTIYEGGMSVRRNRKTTHACFVVAARATRIPVTTENVQMTEKVVGTIKPCSSPKHSQDTWFKVRIEYESGRWTSLKELGDRFGINHKTLWSRIDTEKWDAKRSEILRQAQEKIERKSVSVVSEYLTRLTSRAAKYERMLDASADNAGSKLEDGTPVIDAELIDTLTRSEMRVVEMNKVGLRLAPPSVDITTGGASIGESIVSAIARLRESNTAIDISDAEVARIAKLEVIPDDQR